MGLRFKVLLVFLFSFSMLRAQEWSSQFTNFIGSGKSNDLGLSISHYRQLKENSLSLTLEMRTINWGNQFNLGIGYKAKYKTVNKWQLGGHTKVFVGAAPFNQKSMMAYGAAFTPYLKYSTSKRLFCETSFGFRYNIIPGYTAYGINHQMEFPLQISIGLQSKRAI